MTWLKYFSQAPLVRLTSTDPYFPSDIGAQITNTHPQLNNTDIPKDQFPTPLSLSNLDSLNNISNSNGGSFVYLASNQPYAQGPYPQYFHGVKPDASGKTGNAVSSAIIVNEKANGTTDAFYMYFYAYNQGDTVLGHELGDHVGDWEHNMVRFVNGKPSAIWYSQHANGEAFEFNAYGLEKNGSRPVAYSANGTHANYATNGTHDHTIPNLSIPEGFLEDVTDQKGAYWDPLKSAYYYFVTFPEGAANGDSSTPTFTAADNGVNAGSAPTAWLYFKGAFGNDQLPDSTPGQDDFFSFRKFTGGPTGPRDKQLNRADVCPSNGDKCIHRSIVTPGN